MEIKLPETKTNTKRTSKLGRSEWIEAAFRVLTESGVSSINVEKLAKRLGVMDASAIALARDNNLPIIVFSLDEPGGFRGILAGEGTYTKVQG